MTQRLGARAGVLGLAALAGGCASIPAAAPPPVEAPRGPAYAAVLTARFAAQSEAPRTALDRLTAALADTDDAALLPRAVEAALIAGDLRAAAGLAAQAERAGVADDAARTAAAMHALSEGRRRPALEAARRVGREGDMARYARIAEAFALAELNQTDAALALAADGLRFEAGANAYMRALLMERAGRPAEAAAAYADAAALTGGGFPDGLVREAALRVRIGDAAGAQAALGRGVGSAPLLRAARERLARGEPLAPARLSTRAAAALAVEAMRVLTPPAALTERRWAALAPFTFALALDPSLASTRLDQAIALRVLGRRREAAAALAAVPPAAPQFETAQVTAIELLLEIDATGDAVAAAEALTTALPQAPRTRLVLAGTLLRDNQPEAALAATEAALRDPGRLGGLQARTHQTRAQALAALGRTAEADAALERARDLAPNDPGILNDLAGGWARRGVRLEEALALLQRAARARPRDGRVADNLGLALARLGRLEEAIAQLERAAALAPEVWTAHANLGDVYWRVGRRAEARYQWSHALTAADLTTEARAGLAAKLERGLGPDAAPAPP